MMPACQVLEALNRLLDDNRELYIPDTDTIVKPHEDFMVAALSFGKV